MEKITINLFTAGPLKFKKERDLVNKIALDIKIYYQKLNYDIEINPHTFDTSIFDPKQEEYNQFIENEADLVLFFWDDSVKEETEKEKENKEENEEETGTEQEYKTAANQNEKEGKPAFYVFVKENMESERLKELMSQPSKVYYKEYKDDVDLEYKIRDQIKKIIDKRIAKKNKRTIRGLSILSLLAALSALAIGYTLYQHKGTAAPPESVITEPDTMLVLAGGGSVVNFINLDIYDKNVLDFPNSIYVNMPSGNAWLLLIEEAYKNDNQRTFNTICLSADKLDTTIIKSKINNNANKARIIELKLGEDALAVYMKTELAKKLHFTNNSVIDVEQLKNYLANIKSYQDYNIMRINKNDSISLRLFTTSSNSGTLRAYENAFSTKNPNTNQLNSFFNNINCNIFFDSSCLSYIKFLSNYDASDLPYIVFGSEYYYPKDIYKDTEHITKIYLKDQDGKKTKPIHIYFAATNGNNDLWKVDHHIVDFLKEINAKKFIKNEEVWNNLVNKGFIEYHEKNIICNLNTL